MSLARPRTFGGGTVAPVRRTTLAWIASLVYVGCAVIALIDVRSVWLDESVSVAIASQPYMRIAQILTRVDAVHGLYYSLLHLWLVFGQSAVVIRLLSAFLAIAASVAIGLLARTMFGADRGPAAVAVVATSAFFLFYADEARPTALTLLLCALAALAFWRACRTGRTRDFAIWGLCAAGAVYANFVALLFIMALPAGYVFLRPSRQGWLRVAVTGAAVAVAIVPLVALIAANSLVQIDWIVRANAVAVADFIVSLLGGDGGAGRIGHLSGLLEAGIVAALVVTGFAAGFRTPASRPAALAVAAWLVLPLAAGIVIDHSAHPLLMPRYFSFALIPIALLAANGLSAVMRAWRPAAAVAVAALLALISVHNVLTMQRENWRAVSQYVARDARPGDALVFWAPLTVSPYAFAAREIAATTPAAVAYPNGALVNAVDFPQPRPDFNRQLSRAYGRIFLIESHDGQSAADDPFNGLSRYYVRTGEANFSGVEVVTFSRHAALTHAMPHRRRAVRERSRNHAAADRKTRRPNGGLPSAERA
jgi:mannosyltransferase